MREDSLLGKCEAPSHLAQITQGWTSILKGIWKALEQSHYGAGHSGAGRGHREVTPCEAIGTRTRTGNGRWRLGTLSLDGAWVDTF